MRTNAEFRKNLTKELGFLPDPDMKATPIYQQYYKKLTSKNGPISALLGFQNITIGTPHDLRILLGTKVNSLEKGSGAFASLRDVAKFMGKQLPEILTHDIYIPPESDTDENGTKTEKKYRVAKEFLEQIEDTGYFLKDAERMREFDSASKELADKLKIALLSAVPQYNKVYFSDNTVRFYFYCYRPSEKGHKTYPAIKITPSPDSFLIETGRLWPIEDGKFQRFDQKWTITPPFPNKFDASTITPATWKKEKISEAMEAVKKYFSSHS